MLYHTPFLHKISDWSKVDCQVEDIWQEMAFLYKGTNSVVLLNQLDRGWDGGQWQGQASSPNNHHLPELFTRWCYDDGNTSMYYVYSDWEI